MSFKAHHRRVGFKSDLHESLLVVDWKRFNHFGKDGVSIWIQWVALLLALGLKVQILAWIVLEQYETIVILHNGSLIHDKDLVREGDGSL